jgi:glycosyltransferase involved in cell wall biosynthesis
MAVGTPIVASNVAGIPELLDAGRCGILVPPGDVGALAKAMATLLADESLRIDYARAARSHLEGPFNLRRNGWQFAETLRATQRYAPRADQ